MNLKLLFKTDGEFPVEDGQDNFRDTSAAPGKNFKVMQHVVRFDGKFSAESCKLHSAIKIFESETSQFEDPDNFTIKTQ